MTVDHLIKLFVKIIGSSIIFILGSMLFADVVRFYGNRPVAMCIELVFFGFCSWLLAYVWLSNMVFLTLLTVAYISFGIHVGIGLRNDDILQRQMTLINASKNKERSPAPAIAPSSDSRIASPAEIEQAKRMSEE